jgi:arylsulfatase B
MLGPLLALLPLAVGAGADGPPEQPNVLVIVIDDASWEDFAAAGTDRIAQLAGAGRVFTRFYTSPTCSPSRYQLHFGRYPHRRLIGTALSAFTDAGAPTEDVSLAERLGAAGYATGLFGKWHVNGKQLPIQSVESARVHGFQTWRAGSFSNISSTGSHYSWTRIDDGVESTESRYSTLAINEALIDWWNATEGPRFAVCSYLAPHEPFEAPPKELVPEVPGFLPTNRLRFEWALVGVDRAVEALAGAVELSNTFVFLLPDNGTPPDVLPPQAKAQGYKLSPYEGGIRVPLVAWGPGIAAGVDASLIQISDLYATIVELCGASAPGEVDSHSFTGPLKGAGGGREAVWAQRFTPNGGPVGQLTIDSWTVLRSDGMKLLVDDDFASTSGPPPVELYDLTTDPWETTPLVDPTVQAELEALRVQFLGPDWPYPF